MPKRTLHKNSLAYEGVKFNTHSTLAAEIITKMKRCDWT